ncbi:MAG: hypothetical protein LBL85_01230 [Methanocalculaceae archaeon]|jgi:hypothetical protein|nr:hypothetical protein [Methanocalculaceae archaeon]
MIPAKMHRTPGHCTYDTASYSIMTEVIMATGSSEELRIVAVPVEIFGVPTAGIQQNGQAGTKEIERCAVYPDIRGHNTFSEVTGAKHTDENELCVHRSQPRLPGKIRERFTSGIFG